MCHPILEATESIGDVLKGVRDANPVFLSMAEKAAALKDLAVVEAQVVELRLRVLAEAADLADSTGARDAAAWIAHATHVRHEDARADLALASSLHRTDVHGHPLLAAGMADGTVNLAQARVIARALDRLVSLPPDSAALVTPEVIATAEERLVGYAGRFGPTQLARLGRRILDVIAPELADAAEASRLAHLEANAHQQSRLSLRRQGDGTTRITGRIPDADATRLATYLTAFTNPRQASTERSHADQGTDAVARLPYPRKLGQALCRFLERVDPSRLPLHGGDATTLVVTIDLEKLRCDLATAGVLGSDLVPTDATTGEEVADTITAGQARRLACTASILPVVLGGDSVPLDLGRTRRLFSSGQRKALQIRDRTCRAEGCEIPGTWCEAHHRDPWSTGGSTDLADGMLLCGHHHHRIHDPGYDAARLANGDVRFHRRR